MIRFSIGLSIIIFTLTLGIYHYANLSSRHSDEVAALEEAETKRVEGKDLTERIRVIRRYSVTTTDAQKFNIERMLDIGAPGMEWRFVGQPLVRGTNRALYRYTFRVMGPTTYAQAQDLLDRMNLLPGFVPYRFCYACTQNPRGTPDNLRIVQIEGYLYAYDPNTLY